MYVSITITFAARVCLNEWRATSLENFRPPNELRKTRITGRGKANVDQFWRQKEATGGGEGGGWLDEITVQELR